MLPIEFSALPGDAMAQHLNTHLRMTKRDGTGYRCISGDGAGLNSYLSNFIIRDRGEFPGVSSLDELLRTRFTDEAKTYRGCSIGVGTNADSRKLLQSLSSTLWDWEAVSILDIRDQNEKTLDDNLGIRFTEEDATVWVDSQPNDSLNLVHMNTFLHCLVDPLTFVEHLYRRMMPGGIMIFDIRNIVNEEGYGFFSLGRQWETLVNNLDHKTGLYSIVFGLGSNSLSATAYCLVDVPTPKAESLFGNNIVISHYNKIANPDGDMWMAHYKLARFEDRPR